VIADVKDRTERFSYDAFGRQVWHADAAGDLDYTAYDADGKVTQSIRYAQPRTGSLPAGTAALAISGNDRVSRNYYNAFGQLTYTVDPLNRVTLNAYDPVGRLSTTTRYAGAIAAGTVVGAFAVIGLKRWAVKKPVDTVETVPVAA